MLILAWVSVCVYIHLLFGWLFGMELEALFLCAVGIQTVDSCSQNLNAVWQMVMGDTKRSHTSSPQAGNYVTRSCLHKLPGCPFLWAFVCVRLLDFLLLWLKHTQWCRLCEINTTLHLVVWPIWLWQLKVGCSSGCGRAARDCGKSKSRKKRKKENIGIKRKKKKKKPPTVCVGFCVSVNSFRFLFLFGEWGIFLKHEVRRYMFVRKFYEIKSFSTSWFVLCVCLCCRSLDN